MGRHRLDLTVTVPVDCKMSGAAAASVLLVKKRMGKRQRAALREAFKKADVNGDGKLSVKEYWAILQRTKINLSEEELKQVIATKDVDGDGMISIKEFMGEAEEDPVKKKAELAFDIIDKDKDGYITKMEYMQLSDKITKKQANAIIRRNDEDGDGKLS